MRKTNGVDYSGRAVLKGLKRASGASEGHSVKGKSSGLPLGCYYDSDERLRYVRLNSPDERVAFHLEKFRPPMSEAEVGDNSHVIWNDVKCLRPQDADLARLNNTLKAVFLTCELAGFEVEGRIYLKDKKTGEVWRW